MMRWKQWAAMMLVVGAGALGACKDSTEPNPCEPFEGTWNATTFTYTHNLVTGVVVDVLNVGATIQLVADDNCAYSGTAFLPNIDPVNTLPLSGTFTLGDGTLQLMDDNVTILNQTFDYVLSGNTLTLVRDDTAFDFDQDGTADPVTESATLELVLTRS